MAIQFISGLSITGNSEITGTLSVSSVLADNNTYTGIMVWDGGTLKYRSKSQILSDIGATGNLGTVTSVTVQGTTGLSGSGTVTSSGTITLTNADRGSSQSIFKNFSSDSGSTTANSNNDTLEVLGAGGTTTKIVGDTLTITSSDNNDNNYVSSLSFNTGNGILTAARNGLSSLTVDLDGRYATSSGVTSINFKTDGTALNVASNTITGSGTMTGIWQGTSSEYVNGLGDRVTFPSIPQGDITNVSTTAPISGGGSSGSVNINHDNSGVSAGTYARATVTVNATGHVTSISANSDAQGVTSVATTNGITGGTITSTGTIQLDSTVVRTTGNQSIGGIKTFVASPVVDYAATTNPMLSLFNTSGGSGSTIRFSDQAGQSQTGDITFFHVDGASQGGGASWHFVSQPDTVLVVGSSSVNGRFVAKSAGSVSEVDYGFFDDVNTGMYRAAADTVRLVGGGVYNLGVSATNAALYYQQNLRFSTTDSGATVAGGLIIAGSNDALLDLNQTGTDTGWSYINFKTLGTRNYYVGQDSNKNFNIYNDNINVVAISVSYASNLTTIGGDLTVSGGDITLGGTGRIQGVDTVSASTDAANKAYVDSAISGVPQGTVTAVKANTDGNSLGLSGSVTTNGTLTLPWQGSTSQYVRGDGSLATFPAIPAAGVTSVAMSHGGNAFTVGGSPVTSSGTLAITMAGSSSQYVRGDGNLASFPAIPAVGNGTLTMSTSTGLDGSASFTANQSGNSTFAVTLDLSEITLSAGLDAGATSLSLDLSEFTDMTAAMNTNDEFIVLDSSAERRKRAGEIGLSIFNNDAGFITGNQTITLSGDVSGSGTTSISTTLDTVNSNVGSFTNASITVDGKGRVTAASSGSGGGGGNVSNTGTPADDQLAVWTNSTTIEGTSSLTFKSGELAVEGIISVKESVYSVGNLYLGATSGSIRIRPKGYATTTNESILDVNGQWQYTSYTSSSTGTTGTSVSPNQNFQAASSDSLANLCVDDTGDVVRGSQEATFTFTRAQLNVGFGSGGTTLINAPGANKFVVVEETNWMLYHEGSGNQTNALEIRQGAVASNAPVARFVSTRMNEIISMGDGVGMYSRDVPELQRVYKVNQATTMSILQSPAFGSNIIKISVKIKYRVYDSGTF